MPAVLVDSNVLLDLFTEDSTWYGWSAGQLESLASTNALVINPIIYAEISYRFSHIEALEAVLDVASLRRDPLPWEAAFLAAKCHRRYRDRGGMRIQTLPDFFIGAHAAVAGFSLLTRDTERYRAYFPQARLIAP